jgi:hypothetical protein
MLLLGLAVPGVAEPTYGDVASLPEPDLVLTDRLRDVDVYGGARLPHTDWEDLLEIQVFLTDRSLIFLVRTSGELPAASNLLHSGLLLVFVDVDGAPGQVPFSPYLFDLDAVRKAGYEFAIGQNGPIGLRRVSTLGGATAPYSPIEHWRDDAIDYFEVAWEQLGGRPDHPISFFVFTARVRRGGFEVILDRAPNNRPETIVLAP